jgi:predicted nucleic acid-binding protein
LIYDASSLYVLLKRGGLRTLPDVKTLDLAFYEVGNSMLKELRRKLMTPESFERALAVLSVMSEIVQVRKFGELDAKSVSRFAKESGLTFYDATYLTLASASNEALVSNDNFLRKKAEGLGVRTLSA